jgi:hypothetical protein
MRCWILGKLPCICSGRQPLHLQSPNKRVLCILFLFYLHRDSCLKHDTWSKRRSQLLGMGGGRRKSFHPQRTHHRLTCISSEGSFLDTHLTIKLFGPLDTFHSLLRLLECLYSSASTSQLLINVCSNDSPRHLVCSIGAGNNRLASPPRSRRQYCLTNDGRMELGNC